MDSTDKNMHLLANTPSEQGEGYYNWHLSEVIPAAKGFTYNTTNNVWKPITNA